MFGLEMLDVAIGLTFVYLLLSLISSAIRESLEAWSKSRAAFLERGLLALFEGPGAKTDTAHQLVESLYNHPRIYGLFEGSYERAGKARSGAVARRLPSYIAASTFSDALIDTVARRCQNVPSMLSIACASGPKRSTTRAFDRSSFLRSTAPTATRQPCGARSRPGSTRAWTAWPDGIAAGRIGSSSASRR
jgi:hypothetical protein